MKETAKQKLGFPFSNKTHSPMIDSDDNFNAIFR